MKELLQRWLAESGEDLDKLDGKIKEGIEDLEFALLLLRLHRL